MLSPRARLRGRLSAVIGLLSILGAALVVAAGPASAATCSGHGCDNKNPYSAGCDTGSSVIYDAPLQYTDSVDVTSQSGRVRLHYSPACRTVWASVYDLPKGVTSDWQSYAEVVRSDHTELYCDVPIGETSCYTYMLYDAGVTSYAAGYYYGYDYADGYNVGFYGSTGSY